MNMKIFVVGCFSDLFGINFVQPIFFGNFFDGVLIKPLQRKSHIGVLLNLPIKLPQIPVNHFARFIHHFHGFPDSSSLLSVKNIGFGCFNQPVKNQNFFNNILHLLNVRNFFVFEPSFQNLSHSFRKPF